MLTLLTSLTWAAPAISPGRPLPDPGKMLRIGPGRPLPRFPLFFALPGRPQADSDPIRFTIQTNQQSVRLGEPVELVITAELLNIAPSLLFTLPGANAYRLKLLLPPGFEQTGGDFVDYVGDQLSYPSRMSATYRVTGYFSSVKAGTQFQLLRSHSQADAQSLFVEKSSITLQPYAGEGQPVVTTSQPNRLGTASTLLVDMRDARASARVAAGNFQSHLDAANCDYVTGWIIDFNNKNAAPTADIYINGTKVASVVATINRKDVADAYGITTFNQYGFLYAVPAAYKTNAPLSIAVRYTGTTDHIIGSPATTATCAGPVSTTTSPVTSTTAASPVSSTTAVTPTTPVATTTTTPTSSTTIPAVNPNASYYGFLDMATCDSVRGWAFDRNLIKQSIGVDLFINGTKVATLLANRPRPDVANAFGIQGFNAYEYAYKIPDSYKKGAAITVAARVANTNVELINSPRTTAVCTTTVTTPVTTPTPVTKPDTCQFSLSTSPSLSATCGSTVTLSAACAGANCNRVTYTWKGNGLTTTGQSVSLVAPTTNGTISYTVTASASGCASQTATGMLTVTGCTSATTTPVATTTTTPVSSTTIPAVNPNASYYGFLDMATCDSVRGWAFDRNLIKQSIGVDLFINGTKVATLLANRPRPDVANAFGIQGFNAYEYAYKIPDGYKKGATITVTARVANTAVELMNSPRTTAVCGTTITTPVTKPDTCQFSLSTSPSLSATCGSTVTLSAACAGANCNRVTYAWKGNGLTTTGQSVSLIAPTTNGTTSYTVTASASGCASQTAAGMLTVTGCTSATTTPSPTTTNAKYQGFLETANCDGIAGWLIDQNNPKQSQAVDIYLNSIKVATVPVNRARQDVADAYGIQGYNAYGYYYAIPAAYKANAALKVSVMPAGTSRDLSLSPRTTAVCPGSGQLPTTPPVDSCQFTLGTMTPTTVGCGSAVVLNASCSGANCNRVTYTWKGSGLTATGQTINLTAPSTNSVYSYTLTASAPGCSSQSVTGTVSVTGCTTPTITTPAPTTTTITNAKYVGFLESANCDGISGWVVDINNTKRSPSLDVYLNGVKVATITADRARQDVADAYGIQGYNAYGYYYAIPAAYKANAALKVSVMPAGTSRDLSLSPRTTAVCPGSGQLPTPPAPVADSCQFSLSTSPISVSCGTSVTLQASCSQATYTWVGGGTTQTGQQVTLTAPSANGTTTYTVTATAKGCPAQSATFDLITTGCTTTPTPTTTTTPVTTPPTPVVTNAKYQGFLETANCDVVAGWVLDANNTKRSPSVDVYLNNVKVATITADRARQDVADAYGVQGYNTYGYLYAIPDNYKSNAPLTVSIKPSATTTDLSLSPRTTASCAGSGTPPSITTPINTTGTGCQFTLTTTNVNAACGSTVTLNATCAGANCDRVSYAWSGGGIGQSGQSITFNVAAANGTTTYTVTGSATGCPAQSATATVTVSGCASTPTEQGDYPVLSSPYPSDKRPVLQNERVRVAVDLGVGGVIREVTDLQVGENMINCMVYSDGRRDPGRDDQISLYGMPNAATGWSQGGKPVLDDIGYNPVQGGDIAGNFSPMLGYGRTDKVLYTKTRNLLWGLNNEPGHYIVEQWIRLDGNVVKRHVKIVGNRPDNTKYDDVRQQELPCTYTNSAYYQYYIAQGDPYSNAPSINVNSIQNLGGSGTSLNNYRNQGQMGPLNVDSSEPWIAAIRPSNGRGLALHTPYSHEFKVGLFNEMGWGPPESINAGYIANTVSMPLDPNGVYEFDINMIVGTLSEIRNTVNTLPRSETKPNYIFNGNPTRCGFYYRKGYDQGFPVGNELVITPTDRRFKIVSPNKGYRASETPTLYVRMRAITTETRMILEWRKVGQTELEAAQADQTITFNVQGDNQYHTIAIPTGQNSKWSGTISNFSIRYENVSETKVSGHQLGIKWISANNLGDF